MKTLFFTLILCFSFKSLGCEIDSTFTSQVQLINSEKLDCELLNSKISEATQALKVLPHVQKQYQLLYLDRGIHVSVQIQQVEIHSQLLIYSF